MISLKEPNLEIIMLINIWIFLPYNKLPSSLAQSLFMYSIKFLIKFRPKFSVKSFSTCSPADKFPAFNSDYFFTLHFSTYFVIYWNWSFFVSMERICSVKEKIGFLTFEFNVFDWLIVRLLEERDRMLVNR